MVIVSTASWAGACEPASCRDEPVSQPRLSSLHSGFVPPNPGERQIGLGTTHGLSDVLTRSFAVSDSFRPMPTPAPGEWLAEFRETGQSFNQFVEARPNRASPHRRTIYILPIDPEQDGGRWLRESPERPDSRPFDRVSTAVLAEYAGLFYDLPVRVLPRITAVEVGARGRINRFSKQRQLLSTDILAYLEKKLPHDARALIGLTTIDLYPEPAWNFVFGQASLSKRVGVYSLARYHHPAFYGESSAAAQEVDALVLRRSLKVLVHELGHMFGVEHCIYYLCVMNGSNHLRETDAQPLHLCPIDLRKLHHSIGFEPLARYRNLGSFYREHGLDEEARWIERRMAEIAGIGAE